MTSPPHYTDHLWSLWEEELKMTHISDVMNLGAIMVNTSWFLSGAFFRATVCT